MDVLPEADGNTSFESTSPASTILCIYLSESASAVAEADGHRIWVFLAASLQACCTSWP